MNRRQDFLLTALGGAVGSRLPESLRAGTYPDRPVRMLVGFPENGPVDISGRLISPWLSARFCQVFAVENKLGDSGNKATREAAKAAPDGYTLLVCGPVNTINTTLFPELDFNFSRDLEPVAGLYKVPLVIEVNQALPIGTATEFLAYAKANPGKLKVAHAGNGTPQHVAIELFKVMAGVDLKAVDYNGSAPALTDLVDGKVDAMFDPIPSSIDLIRKGVLRPLAVTTPVRSPSLVDVPPISDVLPGYEAGSWFGIAAPKGTPTEIIAMLNARIDEGLTNAAIAGQIAGLGGTAMRMTPGEFAAFVNAETERYAGVIHLVGIKPR